MAVLLPHLADVVVERVEEVGGSVLIWAHPRAARATCPRCGGESGRVHSRYERRLADAAVAGQRVQIRLRVRRFFCDGERCGARTFAVSLDHAGLRPPPQQPGQLLLPVAMADNVTAPRGVLVWLVGGPGTSGVGLTAVIARQFDPEVLRNYRLVLFSARGTGPGALQCPQLQQALDDLAASGPPPSAVHACAQSLGDHRRFYTTADPVADLDKLRQALGVATLTLAGVSYGTFVAERYAITHPDRVSRLVLDSVVPHDSFDPLEIAPSTAPGKCSRWCVRKPGVPPTQHTTSRR